MSVSEKIELIKFKINVPDDFIRFTLVNGKSEIVGKSTETCEFDLDTGYYLLIIEQNGIQSEQLILHTKENPAHITITSPGVYSSILLDGAKTSHEYYTDPAEEWSKKTTCKKEIDKFSSSIFLFFRFIDIDVVKKLDSQLHPFQNFYFRTKDELIDLTQIEISETNLSQGWAAFMMPVEEGYHYLVYKGKEQREIPLFISSNRQTQGFLIVNPEPCFDTLRIAMTSPGQGFYPFDRDLKIIDTASNRLQNAKYSLPKSVLNELLHGKFGNPMLGLIGLHLCIRKGEYPYDFNLVLQNLIMLFGGNEIPDIKALRLIHAEAQGEKLPEMIFHDPPILRHALEAVARLASINPKLLTDDSPIHSIAQNIYSDTPFSCWKPFQEKSKKISTKESFSLIKNIIGKKFL